MRVLIVKVSSMGEIVHTLPAITDAFRAKKGLIFDWVVEEEFTEIPAWHPAVDKVIPVALRRWRKNLWQSWLTGEFGEFKHELQKEHYDLVIDAQGLIKSGFISRIAKGLTVGLSNHTVKEPLATLFYNVVYTVPWQQHAVERIRDLFSRTFNYAFDYNHCDYGIDKSQISKLRSESETKYLVFLPGTSWETKKWPEIYWVRLARIANKKGYAIKVLCESRDEFSIAETIASGSGKIDIVIKNSIAETAGILQGAVAVVAVESGMAHLAAALEIPMVSIYGASDFTLSGAYGKKQIQLKSTLSCSPCMSRTCQYKGNAILDNNGKMAFEVTPPCFASNTPETVWRELEELLMTGEGSMDSLFSTEF